MKLFSSFGASTPFSLTRAILLYTATGTANGDSAIATMHDVVIGENGRPEIQPGACVQQEAVQDLALGLLQTGKLELLPPNLIALGLKGMIWHCPAAVRQLWFAPFGDEPDKKRLRKISGERFPQPHLLFHASPGGLDVFALRGTGKPTAKTALYQAPYWNVNHAGRLCIGNARIPTGASVSHMPKCEKGFFESNFTHSNSHADGLVKFKGGHNALWPSLKGKRHFPEGVLLPLKNGRKAYTVADLLAKTR